jgi:ketosteroid isomerase-like protein
MSYPTRLLVSLALACAAFASRAIADDAADIRAARVAQNAAIARHDLNAIASFWTENVTICRGLGLQASGKASYLELFRNDDPTTGLVYERVTDDVSVSADWPLAFETGHWVGRRAGQPVLGGRYSAQWVRDGQRWLIRGEVYVALQAHGDGKEMKSAPATAAGGDAETAIPALLHEFLTHVDDPAMHARFWADDIVYTSGKGEVRGKAQIVASVAAAAKSLTPTTPRTTYGAEEIRLRAYGAFAALNFRLLVNNPDGTHWYSRNSGTFVFRDGRWQVVTWQATRETEAK